MNWKKMNLKMKIRMMNLDELILIPINRFISFHCFSLHVRECTSILQKQKLKNEIKNISISMGILCSRMAKSLSKIKKTGILWSRSFSFRYVISIKHEIEREIRHRIPSSYTFIFQIIE